MGAGNSAPEGAEGGEAAAAAAQGAAPAGAPAAAPSPPAEEPAKPAEGKAPEPPKDAAEAKADEEKPKKPKKEGKGKGKGKEGEEPKGKEGKAGKAAGKEGKGKEGKEAKGKEAKGKEAKGKEAKGKDAAKGKGKEKGAKGPAVKGSGPTAGGSGYRLNVKNLGKITEEKLKELFEPFGTVSMAEIKKNDKGESRGFGFVVLPGEAEGEAAAKEMNGKEVEGTKLNVAAAERRATEEDDKGKGKGKTKAKGPQEQYAQYAQQWAAYSQMMYYQQYQQYAAMQQQNSFWAKSAAASPDKEFEGSLKSISSRNGYGFIVCKETYDMFPTVDKDGNIVGRDVYIEEALLPEGAERGSRLVFTVKANDKGHPQAVTCRLAPAI